MYDLTHFDLSDMTRCGAELRNARLAGSMEETVSLVEGCLLPHELSRLMLFVHRQEAYGVGVVERNLIIGCVPLIDPQGPFGRQDELRRRACSDRQPKETPGARRCRAHHDLSAIGRPGRVYGVDTFGG